MALISPFWGRLAPLNGGYKQVGGNAVENELQFNKTEKPK